MGSPSNKEYSSFIALSRYARWLPEKGRRETWEETVARYIGFFGNRGMIGGEIVADLYEAIINLEVMPSMRALMTAGEALDRDNVAGFNCSYLAMDRQRAFDELMYILLCGTGVGFSCERQYISKLPIVSEELHKTDTTIVVADSKIGWASAFRELISLLYSGKIPKWDVSRVRPAGSVLKTFGGRASGPAPLVSLFEYAVNLFIGAVGRKLTSIEVHGLVCKIAEIVVVGGVRRSALISLSNFSDDRMRYAKSGQWWEQHPEYALANNSVCYTEKPNEEAFIREWLSLVESKSGERGIFNREASEKQTARNGRREPYSDFGTNPCCFTGDMKLLTSDGYRTFNSLEGKRVQVISNDGTLSNGEVWCSGTKPTVEVRFTGDRDSITCTGDHIFLLNNGKECKAEDLKGKRLMPHYSIKESFNYDAFLAGFIQGDGNAGRLNSNKHLGLEVYFGEKDADVAQMYFQKPGKWYSREAKDIATQYEIEPMVLPERSLPDWLVNERPFENRDVDTFLSGMWSANGSVIKGHRVSYKATCRKLVDQLKGLLKTRYDIEAYITTNKPKTITFSNGDYVCKESYDLNISRLKDVIKFANSISFGQEYKRDDLKDLIIKRGPHVSTVKDFGVHKIYDFTEPKNHWGVVEGVVVHNSEIILRDRQFCNLSEVVVRATDTFSALKRKVRLAAILGTLQATLTDFRYLSKKWAENTAEEALLGVSLTGIMDHPFLNGERVNEAGYTYDFCGDENRGLEEVLYELKEVAIETNREWAEKLGINVSGAITCVKPSGTVSQLVDSASGIHTRHSPFYIRTVRADKKDPLAQLMVDAGFPVEDDVTKPETTYVFSFPMRSPEDAICRSDRTAIEQLEVWLMYQRSWCEHKPSVTINVKDGEWLEVGAWVYKHFDEVSGISFLPYDGGTYRQAPYQSITEEEYADWLDKMPRDVDWSKLGEYENVDNTSGSQTLSCTGSSCEIVDI